MPTTRTGHATTDRAARYGRQLCSHFAQKIHTTWDDTTGLIAFGTGTCHLTATDDRLQLHVEASTTEGCTRVAEVVDRHLVRFGTRDGLTVQWDPPSVRGLSSG